VPEFKKRYPKVKLVLAQGSPPQLAEMVLAGTADIAIATEALDHYPQLLALPGYSWHHTVVVPLKHPLLKQERLSLEELAKYPIITYDTEFAFHKNIMRTFHAAKLKPDILLSASDAEIMKIYARAGLGIAIVARSAYDKSVDKGLRALDVRHLFKPTVLHVGLRRNVYLTRHLIAFLQLFAPHLKIEDVRKAIAT